MGIEENKEVVRGFIEVILNNQEYDKSDRYIADDVNSDDGDLVGREKLILFYKDRRHNFPDLHREVVDMIAEGDRVITFLNFSGTFPQGTYAKWSVILDMQLKDEQIIHVEAKYGDYLSLYQQLGVVPSTEAIQEQIRSRSVNNGN